MNCLTCSQCKSNYQNVYNEKRIPRVLITCGHTFCRNCIENHLSNGKITCFQCFKVSQAVDINSFPVNQTLIMLLNNHLQSQANLCPIHKKKLQAYCQKQKELICLECQLTIHRSHKVCLINDKATMDRAILRQSHAKILENLQQSNRNLIRLGQDQSDLQSTFIDYQAQINMFYKNIIEQIIKLQGKQIQRLITEKNQISLKITQHKSSISQRLIFLKELEEIFKTLQASSDIDFIKRQNQQSFIINSCKNKKQKYTVKTLVLKKIQYIQEIINSLSQMMQFQKKKMAHSSSNLQANLKESNGNAVQNSPSLKKHSQSNREPAVLEVNLSEEYYKRKINLNLNTQSKKSSIQTNPVKKIIHITTNEKQREKNNMIEAISSRSVHVDTKSGKSQLKFIRESSIKRSKHEKQQSCQSSFLNELDLSQNYQTQINSFMRTSRDQSIGNLLNQESSSIKHSFNDFSLLDIEEHVYHFGGRINTTIQKYSIQNGISIKLNIFLNKKHTQIIFNKCFGNQKCLIIGGSNNQPSQQNGAQIYQFNFKSQKLSRTKYCLSHPRISFGCISKQQSFYVFGGRNDKTLLNTFQKYTFLNNHKLSCQKMPNMKQYRQDLGYCMGYDGYLYAAGGVNNNKSYLNSCERFNWNKFSWEIIASMNHQRRGFSLIPVPHGIYAIGGHSGSKVLAQVELYDFNKKQWIQISSMLVPRCFHSAIISKDQQSIIIFGGFNNQNSSQLNEVDSVQIYDIKENSWKIGNKMQCKRGLHSSILKSS